jgi:hypothetical protein
MAAAESPLVTLRIFKYAKHESRLGKSFSDITCRITIYVYNYFTASCSLYHTEADIGSSFCDLGLLLRR